MLYLKERRMTTMFENCKKCIPPKRQPGCHDKCPDYIKDKKEHDEFKKKIREKNSVPEASIFLDYRLLYTPIQR